MLHRPIRWLALLALLGLAAGACSNGNPRTTHQRVPTDPGLFPAGQLNKAQHVGTPRYGGTLTFGLESAVMNLAPNGKVIQPSDLAVESAVFDSLITSDDHDEPVLDNASHRYNQLADSLSPSDDLKTWTLKLRKGLQFSNGEPVTADEVVSHTRWIMSTAGLCSCSEDANNIASVTVGTDGLTVIYRLKAPNVAWPNKLSDAGLGWITESKAREAAADPTKPSTTDLIGAGPFAFSTTSGDSHTVVKNPHYYGVDAANADAKLPYLDKIVFLPLANTATRLQAVASNGVQIMQTADTSNLVNAKKNPELVVQPISGSSSTIQVLNLTRPPFGVFPRPGEEPQATAIRGLDDPTARKARQAYALSLNRNEVNQKYYKGARVPAYGFIPGDSPYFDPKGQLPHFDQAEAAKLVDAVKQAGVDFTAKRMCIPGPEASGVYQILQQQAKTIGITSKQVTVEQGVLVNTLLAGKPTGATKDWNISCFRAPQIADPDGLYGSLHTGGPTNLVQYSRPDVDRALDEGRSTTDPKARKVQYDIVQEQVAKDSVYVPLLFDYYGNVHRSNVSGLSRPSPQHLGLISPATLYFTAS